jgi:hypothetical protein
MKALWKLARWAVLQLVAFVAVLGLMLVLVSGAHFAVASATKMHWLLGIAVGSVVLLAIVVLWVAVLLSTRPNPPAWAKDLAPARTPNAKGSLMQRFPAQSMTVLFFTSLLAAILVLAPISELLASHGICTYHYAEKSKLPLTELLIRMYAWHTIDALPAIDAWEVVKLRPTLQPANTRAQVLVLAYRLVVVGIGISALVQWLAIRKDRRKRARRARAASRSATARR